MSSLKLRYKNFCEFMETNTKGVEIGIYSVSGLLFAVAYFKIRPLTKFGKPNDIPRHFISGKIIQNGTIKSIEPNQSTGAILRVNHKPPINLLFASQKTLPVKIFGIEINSNGYSWLQTVTINQKVQFLPLVKKNDYAECQVKLLQDRSVSSKSSIDLAESLISLGFARTSDSKSIVVLPEILTKDEQLKKYQQKLDKIQTKAKQNRLGLWLSIVPPSPWPLNVIKAQASKFIFNKVLPTKLRLPELVR